MEPKVPGALGCATCEVFAPDRIAVLCRSLSLTNPLWASFTAGRPESVIGNRLFAAPSLLVSMVDSVLVAARPWVFCGAFRWGMKTATKIRIAVTTAPAAMMTKRFCWIGCLARCLLLVAASCKASAGSTGVETSSASATPRFSTKPVLPLSLCPFRRVTSHPQQLELRTQWAPTPDGRPLLPGQLPARAVHSIP